MSDGHLVVVCIAAYVSLWAGYFLGRAEAIREVATSHEATQAKVEKIRRRQRQKADRLRQRADRIDEAAS